MSGPRWTDEERERWQKYKPTQNPNTFPSKAASRADKKRKRQARKKSRGNA